MKRTKRLLSTLLALCMVLAMLPATALAAGTTVDPNPAPDTPTDRYTVLVLDHSGSMSGKPIEQMREAAKLFCRTVASQQNDYYRNHVAIVGFSDEADAPLDFTTNITALESHVDAMRATYTTDIIDGLRVAKSLLDAKPADAIKNIILLTDGLPVCGRYLENGQYNNLVGASNPRAANKCYQEAKDMGLLAAEAPYHIYTLGFFHTMTDSDKILCRALLKDLAHGGTFYEMSDASQVVVILGGFLLNDITGGGTATDPTIPFDHTKPHLYVTFECPVNVTVKSGSRTVFESAKGNGTDAYYGEMTVTPNATGNKIELCLNPAYIYSLEAVGTGDGFVKVAVDYVNADHSVIKPIAKNETNPDENGVDQGIEIKATQIIPVAIVPAYGEIKEPSAYIAGAAIDKTGDKETAQDVPSHFTFVPTVTGGTVVLSKRNAEPGDWVNIYVTPDEGYELQSITVTDMRGWPVTLREMGENAYSFTMPNARINVNPVFVKTEEPAGDYQYPINVPEVNNSGAPGYGAMVINPGAMNYSDVSAGDWFYDNVKFAHERYLLTGTGEADGKFEPNTAATRASIWVAISRMAGRNTINQGDNWYDRAQVWAKGKGITDGERPMGELTREEFVTMLWRYDGNKYVTNSGLGQFNDGESVSWWATEAVKWAVSSNLLKGDNGSLNPQNNVTRAEVAAVLQRYIQNVR